MAAEATSDLSLVMTFKAQSGQVLKNIVRWIFIYVMNLNSLSTLSANTTRVVGCEQNIRC